jgi:hypothetical protein
VARHALLLGTLRGVDLFRPRLRPFCPLQARVVLLRTTRRLRRSRAARPTRMDSASTAPRVVLTSRWLSTRSGGDTPLRPFPLQVPRTRWRDTDLDHPAQRRSSSWAFGEPSRASPVRRLGDDVAVVVDDGGGDDIGCGMSTSWSSPCYTLVCRIPGQTGRGRGAALPGFPARTFRRAPCTAVGNGGHGVE